MQKRQWMVGALVALLMSLLLLEACAPARTSRSSGIWQRSGSCPATRVDNHVY